MLKSVINGESYNHALFDSMAMFSDVVLQITLDTETVDILLNTFDSDLEGQTFPISAFRQQIVSNTHPDYISTVEQSISIAHLSSLRGPESFDNMMLINGRYHALQGSITVNLTDTGTVSVAYITIRDLQPILDQQEQTLERHRHLEYKVNSVLSAASMGTWSIDIGIRAPKMFGDQTMIHLIGCPKDSTPEQVYNYWFSHIDREYITAVLDCVDKIKSGLQAEVTYLYHHPEMGRIIVRCGGMRDPLFIEEGMKLRGYHQDVTSFNEQLLQQLELGAAIQSHYNSVLNIDLLKNQARILCDRNKSFAPTATADGMISMDLSPYFYKFTDKSFVKIKKYTNTDFLKSELKNKGSLSIEIESISLGWLRATFIPSTYDAQGNVERCICCTESINEYKKLELRQQQKLEKTMSAEKREREALSAIAAIYNSTHVLNVATGEFYQLNAMERITSIIGRRRTSAQNVISDVMKSRFEGDELKKAMDFVNLKTLPDRIAGKTNIFIEVVNRDDQWFELSFIRIGNVDAELEKVVFVTQDIDVGKRESLKLEKRSTTDELTQLLNRYAYESDLQKLEESHFEEPVWYVNFDMNGLKEANDTIGHAAGDELLMGAADCMRKAFTGVGKAYRIGGDEFVAILKGDQRVVNEALEKLEKLRSEWHGEFCSSFSFSKGVVCSNEYEECSIAVLEREADHRMYAEKRAYHLNHGIDRRSH